MPEPPLTDLGAQTLRLGCGLGPSNDVPPELPIEAEPVVGSLPLEAEVPGVPTLWPLAPRAVADLPQAVVVMACCHVVL